MIQALKQNINWKNTFKKNHNKYIYRIKKIDIRKITFEIGKKYIEFKTYKSQI